MNKKQNSLLKQALPSQEEVLYDYAKRLSHHKSRRRAVHLYLSRLSRASQHPQDIRIAVSHFNGLKGKYDGQLFRLSNNDVVFVGRGVTLAELDEVVLKLRYMFRDDDRLKDFERSEDEDSFCTHYNIERDYDAFLADAKNLLDQGPGGEGDLDSSVIPFDAAAAGGKEREATLPPLARHVFVDSVFAWSRNNPPAQILSEVTFRIDSLRSSYGAKRNNFPDLWLLKTLAKDFNENIASHLFGSGGPVPTTLTIPVTPETVISAEFDKFNAHYRSVARTPILFEFNWGTVMRNAHMFLSARDRVLQAGHKLCIEGWDPYTFAFSSPARLDAHFLKVGWRETLAMNFRSEWSAALAETVRASGATKVVLSDCTSQVAADFGHKHGFLLYQGVYPAKIAE